MRIYESIEVLLCTLFFHVLQMLKVATCKKMNYSLSCARAANFLKSPWGTTGVRPGGTKTYPAAPAVDGGERRGGTWGGVGVLFKGSISLYGGNSNFWSAEGPYEGKHTAACTPSR
jgi:hypothetical protein